MTSFCALRLIISIAGANVLAALSLRAILGRIMRVHDGPRVNLSLRHLSHDRLQLLLYFCMNILKLEICPSPNGIFSSIWIMHAGDNSYLNFAQLPRTKIES